MTKSSLTLVPTFLTHPCPTFGLVFNCLKAEGVLQIFSNFSTILCWMGGVMRLERGQSNQEISFQARQRFSVGWNITDTTQSWATGNHFSVKRK